MSIVIGYPHGPDVSHAFHDSLIKTIAHFIPQGTIKAIQGVGAGAMNLDRARNQIVEQFLATDAEWLLQIDTDMKWTPNDIVQLRKTAHRKKRPVVGGLCFKLQGMNEQFGPVPIPVVYRVDEQGIGHPILEYSGVQKVDATGAAFLMVHRDVFEQIGGDWFSHHPKQTTNSEDWAFCWRLRDQGIPIHVDTSVRIGHVKPVVLTENDFRALMQRVAAAEAAEKQQGLVTAQAL